MIEIQLLTRDEAQHWTLLPQVLLRVALFCRKHDTDTTPESLCQSIMEHFVCEPSRQTVRVVVALQDGQLIGHLIVSLDYWCGKLFGTIVQYETDATLPRPAVREALEKIADWAERKGAHLLRVLAIADDGRGDARARLFRSVYGFEPRRIMLDKPLR
jgi:hypothetical protein